MTFKVGSGSLQFELVEGWEQLPTNLRHADVPGVCSDADGNVYVFCRGDNPATPAVDPEPCLNAANPRFTYHAVSFDVTETNPPDVVDGSAKYNAWSPAISTAGFKTVAPGGTAQETITVNPAEWALTPALGLMITTVDNKSKNGGEAQTIPVDFK